jgi:hypothetical protein
MPASAKIFMTGVVTGMFVTALAVVVTPFRALGEESGDTAKLVFTGRLPNVPGKSLTAVALLTPREESRAATTTPDRSSRTCCPEESGPKTPPPDRPKSTPPARAFSSLPAASIE